MNRLAAVLLILALVLAMPTTSSAASIQAKPASHGILAQVSAFLGGIVNSMILWGDFTGKSGGTSSSFTTVIVVEQS